jgi:ABC-type branched-subunit amino acid transport system substrate-binding protein
MHDNIGYGLEWKGELTKAAAQNNFPFVASEMFPLMQIDFTPFLTRLMDAKADVIVVATLGAPAGRIYNTMKKLGMTQPLLLCEAAFNLPFRQTAVNMGEGAYIISTHNSSSVPKDPKFVEFTRKWSTRYSNLGYTGVLTTIPTAFQYFDAMLYLSRVISKRGKDRKMIRDGMETLGPFKGISGVTYVFSRDNHNGSSHLPFQLFRFQKGKVMPVE